MDPQACRAPRETPEREGRTVCLDSLARGVTVASRAWRAGLERRGRQGSLALRDPQV